MRRVPLILVAVALGGVGVRYLNQESAEVDARTSTSLVIPTLPMQKELSVASDWEQKLPNVGDCIVKDADGERYKVQPCTKAHFGKVLKQLQASDLAPLDPLGWKCPQASDGVLEMTPPEGAGIYAGLPRNYCVDTNR